LSAGTVMLQVPAAYGNWDLPGKVQRLKSGDDYEQLQVVKALAEYFLVHERVYEGIRAGCLPALLRCLEAQSSNFDFIYEILGVMHNMALDAVGRTAMIGHQSALATLRNLLFPDEDSDPDQVTKARSVLARTMRNVCQIPEGCDASLENGFIEAIVLIGPVGVATSAGTPIEPSAAAQTEWLRVIHLMISKTEDALRDSDAQLDGPLWLAAAAHWMQDPKVYGGEDYICGLLDVLMSFSMLDNHRDKLVKAGFVEWLADEAIPVKSGLSWKVVAKAWALLASLCIRNPAKAIMAEPARLDNMKAALEHKTADSVLVIRHGFQAVLLIAEHPKAREYMNSVNFGSVVNDLATVRKDEFITKAAQRALAQLDWQP